MIRIYSRENALQRGNTSTAMAGSVAAAARFLAKAALTGDSSVGIPTDEMKNGIGWRLAFIIGGLLLESWEEGFNYANANEYYRGWREAQAYNADMNTLYRATARTEH